MAKKKVKAEKKVEVKGVPHHSGVEVPAGAGDHKNPTVPLENAVNPTSPVYQK